MHSEIFINLSASLSDSTKRNCGGLIESYTGDSSSLFEAVVNCEVEDGGFASSDNLNIAEELAKQGITGGDLTINSFGNNPAPTDSFSPPSNPAPPAPKPCTVTNPNC
jgi:hypothetical protein